ncbi:MAG TPA: peptidylprolyl isomerase [Gemmatimonadaceae bacterium]|nr:peptidylprolyl isomerase [Gemmatimonadaceae bacterium]
MRIIRLPVAPWVAGAIALALFAPLASRAAAAQQHADTAHAPPPSPAADTASAVRIIGDSAGKLVIPPSLAPAAAPAAGNGPSSAPPSPTGATGDEQSSAPRLVIPPRSGSLQGAGAAAAGAAGGAAAADMTSETPLVQLGGPSAGPTTVPVDGVVAVVGNTPILGSEIEERIQAFRAQGQQFPDDSVGRARVVRDVLNAIIDEELLVQRAQVEKVDINENDVITTVDQQLTKIRAKFSTEQEYRAELKKAGFGTPDEYRRWLIEQQRRQQLQQNLFAKLRSDDKLPVAPVTEKEVNAYFEENKGKIPSLPATITLRQIVVSPQPSNREDSIALAKAESVWVELKKGGDFEQIAKRVSMDPGSKDLGGDLGWRRRGDFVPEFDRVYFNLPPNQISPIVKTIFGYHIIRIDRVQPAEVKGRHILIRPEVDSADVVRAKKLADSVSDAWRKGANFDTLVAHFHDPSEEKAIPQAFPQAQLPKEYQAAIADHKQGDVLDPFPIEDKTRGVPKYFIIEITSLVPEHEPSVADWRERIREQLGQEKGIRRYLDNLRKQTFVVVRI